MLPLNQVLTDPYSGRVGIRGKFFFNINANGMEVTLSLLIPSIPLNNVFAADLHRRKIAMIKNIFVV